ncbi:MAG TPA: lysophospholipid acyltransferase family protein [bacterium]|nr:lysophospholipid acyltransferase family protein [bacterium]
MEEPVDSGAPKPGEGRPRKKKWTKRLERKLILTLLPPLAHQWMAWFDRTALMNNEKLLTLINADELLARVSSRNQPSILAVWHNRLMFGPTAYQYRQGAGAVIMVSRSFDGDIISATMSRFKNLRAVRGSSSQKGRDKGGQEALEELIEYGQKGYDLVITPDGPQGPVYQAKRGIIDLAKATGFPIFCVGPNADRCITAKSWDQTKIPFPYARFVYRASDSIYVPADADEAVIEQKRAEVERVLIELTEFADHFFDKPTS